MRTRRGVGFLSAVGALLVGASAHAGTLTSASWYQVTQGVPMTRTTGQLGASGTSTATSLAATLSYPLVSTRIFVQASPFDLAITVKQGGAQAITATPGMADGSPGVPGTVLVMTAIHTGMGVSQSMYHIGANTIVQVPLSHGKAGAFTNTFAVTGVQHKMTVEFYAWTPGTIVLPNLTSNGESLPSVTVAGSFDLTPNGAGAVTLVSPSKVSIDGPLAQRRTAGFTKLVLNFVPEPGSLLLLGAGALALGAAHRRRR